MTWRAKLLGECVDFLSGGTPNKGKPEYWGGDIPWVSSAEMTERFLDKTSLTITQAGLEAGSRLVTAGTTFAVVRGMSLAKEFRISLAQRPMSFNQDVKALIPKPGIDASFIFYSLSAHAGAIRDLATEAAHGTKKLEMSRLESHVIQVPDDLQTQQLVASVAHSYDDLIATNQRRIALLEDAARRLYREWFVRLRFPGYESVPVTDGCPNGWRIGQLADACQSLADGDWIESKDQGGQDYRLIQVSNIGVGCFIETGNHRYVSEDVFRRLRCREVVPGDILISRMPAPIGRAWLAQAMPWKMITAVDVAIAKHSPDVVDPAFLLLHLNSEDNLRLSGQQTSGATRPRISRKQLAALPILLPPLELQVRFAAFIGPGLETIDTLRRQNEELARARDLLLPKLMSGQLDVSGIRLPEEAAA